MSRKDENKIVVDRNIELTEGKTPVQRMAIMITNALTKVGVHGHVVAVDIDATTKAVKVSLIKNVGFPLHRDYPNVNQMTVTFAHGVSRGHVDLLKMEV